MDEKNDKNQDAEYLSKEGFDRLKKELHGLKEVKRREIADRLEYAKGLGDLSENAEYQEAKDDQLATEARISELEDVLGRAVLITQTNRIGGEVGLGSTVKTRKENSSEEETFSIVGPHEVDPESKRISNESPLGRALLGKKPGEMTIVRTPRGEIRYHIIDVI